MNDTQIADVIMTVLRRGNHIGRYRAIHRDALLALLSHYGINIKDRKFRDIYNSDACPVCVIAEYGMWIPDSWHEVVSYLRHYGSKVRDEVAKRRARIMTVAYHELMTRDVGPLFESGINAEARL